MDISEMSLGQGALNRVKGAIDFEDERRKEIAKDFEGVFVRQLLDMMKDTIPEPEDEDSSTQQIKGLFWSFLGDAVAENGGFGLWEHIYESMQEGGGGQAVKQKLDESA